MMQQSEQDPEELAIIPKRAALDSIPEDVALAIVERVKGWALEGKSLQEKEKATKARDSALRAISLSCRENFHFYFPALLENVTINLSHLVGIQGLLQRDNYGHLVRSLHIQEIPFQLSGTARSLLLNDFAAKSSLPSSVDYNIRIEQGLKIVLAEIFRNLPSIETLIIESAFCIPGFFSERHAFLTNSLKKLYIESEKDSEPKMSARNGLWLLLFIPQISEAALGIDVSIEDFKFLLEFGDTVEGLIRVSKLSLGIVFIWNDADRKTWWGLEEGSYRDSAQVNQKTFAVSQLLRCVNTNRLVSLEIVGNFEDQRVGDTVHLLVECLTVLHRSFNSLLHLRLFGLSFREARPDSKCLSNFKAVKMLTLDGTALRGIHTFCPKLVVPSSLEVIWLPCYSNQEFSAENHLLQFVKLRSSLLLKLREVAVPKSPVYAGKLAVNLNLEKWTRMRERLENEEIFTSGRVILRKAEEDEMIGDPSKPASELLAGEDFEIKMG